MDQQPAAEQLNLRLQHCVHRDRLAHPTATSTSASLGSAAHRHVATVLRPDDPAAFGGHQPSSFPVCQLAYSTVA